MYQYGVNINKGMLDELYKKYNERLKSAEKIVYSEIEKYSDKIEEYKLKHPDNKLEDPINIGSPLQLSILFYEILGYKTKAGKGTGVSELEEIGTDLTKAMLEYRKMSKLIDAFLISLDKRGEYISNNILKIA
jgi:DNA polymerase I-like protein with 3'-5' exonuclease and polymerase domains